jgi:O-acetyl-ADP-ribose deacetylase (regulator of RNase III)
MPIELVKGDLLDQDVEAIVNPWNRNFIPWWLLLPQGVSGQIKRRAGVGPFRELSRHGMLKAGEAVHTSAGRLGFKRIIHVAALEWYWRATDSSVRLSASNALDLALSLGMRSVAFPLLGAGTGGKHPARSRELIEAACQERAPQLDVRIVEYSARSGDAA